MLKNHASFLSVENLVYIYILKNISYFTVIQNEIADPCKDILRTVVFWAAFHNILYYFFIKAELILTYFCLFDSLGYVLVIFDAFA